MPPLPAPSYGAVLQDPGPLARAQAEFEERGIFEEDHIYASGSKYGVSVGTYKIFRLGKRGKYLGAREFYEVLGDDQGVRRVKTNQTVGAVMLAGGSVWCVGGMVWMFTGIGRENFIPRFIEGSVNMSLGGVVLTIGAVFLIRPDGADLNQKIEKVNEYNKRIKAELGLVVVEPRYRSELKVASWGLQPLPAGAGFGAQGTF